MPYLDPFKNFAISTVATAPSPASSGLSLAVTAGQGARFPSAAAFNAVIWPAGAAPVAANAEIVRVTVVTTDTLTIVRAQEGSSARTVVVGDQIAQNLTKKALDDIESALGTLSSGGTIDGGAPTTDHTGNIKIDFGSVT